MRQPDSLSGTADVHATALLVGATGLLIRGASGSGKSSLAIALLTAAAARGRFARLVADDRCRLQARGGRILARPAPVLRGLVEARTLGLLTAAAEPACVVRLVVDLQFEAPRLPEDAGSSVTILGFLLQRITLAARDPAAATALTAILLGDVATCRCGADPTFVASR